MPGSERFSSEQLLHRVIAGDREQLGREVTARGGQPARGKIDRMGQIDRGDRDIRAIEIDRDSRRELDVVLRGVERERLAGQQSDARRRARIVAGTDIEAQIDRRDPGPRVVQDGELQTVLQPPEATLNGSLTSGCFICNVANRSST